MKRSFSMMMAGSVTAAFQDAGLLEDLEDGEFLVGTEPEEATLYQNVENVDFLPETSFQVVDEPASALAFLIDVVMENRPDVFNSAMQTLVSSGEVAALTDDICENLLMIAIDTGRARLLQRMLQCPLISGHITVKHIRKAITDCLPDILAIILESGNSVKELLTDDLFPCAIAAGPSITRILLEYHPLTSSEHFLEVLSVPMLVAPVCNMDLAFNSHSSDADSSLLKTVCSLYFPECIRNVMFFFFLLPKADRPDLMSPLKLNELLDLFKALDADGIAKHLVSTEVKILYPEEHLMAALHLACQFRFPAAITGFPTESLEVIPRPQRLAPLLFNATLCGCLEPVENYLNTVLGDRVQGNYVRHSLRHSLDQMVALGDMNSIMLLFNHLPHDSPHRALFNTPLLRLANIVATGDWKLLLVFMECFPVRVLLVESAWQVLLDHSRGEQFRPFVEKLLDSSNLQ